MRYKQYELKCADYADQHDDYFVELICEMHDARNFSSEKCFDLLLWKAEQEGVELVDSDTWDYDAYFQNFYDCTEKGLS